MGDEILQRLFHGVGLALGGLDDGDAVALHHNARNRGGKVGVHVLFEVQQGEQHAADLFVQLGGVVAVAVAVLGGELAVFAGGEDHIVFVVFVRAGVVEDLRIVFGGSVGLVGLAAAD